MSEEATRERPEKRAAEEEAPRARSRVGQALLCPYCRDEVERRGTVACGRRRCGALYHRECWEECATQYGGCAVYGCESRKSREVSLLGYFLRLFRLFLAALLLPPRVVRAVSRHEQEGAVSIFRLSLDRARALRERIRATLWWAVIAFFIGIPLAVGVLLVWLKLTLLDSGENWQVPAVAHLAFVAVYGAAPFTAHLWVPPLFAFLATLGFYSAKSVALALRSEFAALARADQGGGTVLGRMRSQQGKKD